MNAQSLIRDWFDKWSSGDFRNLPIAEHFKHTSPFGTIHGKKEYLRLVEENQDKFLGYRFDLHDELYAGDRGCVRYTAVQGDFTLDVSEWHYVKNGLIEEIIAYYHIGEVREERQLSEPDAGK